MNIELVTRDLENNALIFKNLLGISSRDECKWKSEPLKWSQLEIICHLHDEEIEDFRSRIIQVLKSPDRPFVKIDPQAWVLERNYMEQDFNTMLEKFLTERKNSLSWLNSLKNPDLNSAYVHPKFGPISAKMLLSNWLAHDYLHIRQIIKVKYDYLKFKTGEDLNYAGNW